jgi:hypothetical protein
MNKVPNRTVIPSEQIMNKKFFYIITELSTHIHLFNYSQTKIYDKFYY